MSAPSSGVRATSDRPRVLIVDDHQDSAELLGVLLERSGCEIRAVNGSLEALAVAGEFRPHAAVIDIGLPDMDGYQLLAALRGDARLAECRFIAVTGYCSDELQRRSAEAGFSAHLVKPVDFAALYRVVALGLVPSAASAD
ncbi:MAG TPA: response regulator [Polyangiaceae bacterium]|nr:response regulator [Polyangiaceae bacterium]